MVKRYAFTMIELIFAIVVIAIVVLSLPMMTDIISNSSADTMKNEEAIFAAYVKAIEVTDGNYSSLAPETDSDVRVGSGIATAQGLKYDLKADVVITPGSGFGTLDVGDNNISLVTISIKDSDGVAVRLYTYDFNVTR